MLNRLLLIGALLCILIPGCDNLGGGIKSGGLKAGINYMQPIKWRMTYRFRVQQVNATVPYLRERKWSIDPNVPTVGDGTWEVWFAGPREGEEIRDVKMTYNLPAPTAIERDLDDDIELVYYDFTPDGSLPKEIHAQVQWEFITFERYAYWDGMPKAPYDKTSDLYKKYTVQEKPIVWNKEMTNVSRKFVTDDPEDYKMTALNTYNHVVTNFYYDHEQGARTVFGGYTAMFDATRCWINKTGVCDEFANVLCGMLRINGIPARPVAGFVHEVNAAGLDADVRYAGGHAWAEFYMPEVGWVPLDPTWGMNGARVNIDKFYSLTGHLREIPKVDYYFGKTDPYRITCFKDWDVKLNPKPKTPGADPSEPWFLGYTDRNSGVESITFGWEGVPGKESKY